MEHEKLKVKKSELLRYVMLALAVLLLFVSAVQAYQLAGIEKSETGVGSNNAYSQESGGYVAPQQQAPSMVGGC